MSEQADLWRQAWEENQGDDPLAWATRVSLASLAEQDPELAPVLEEVRKPDSFTR